MRVLVTGASGMLGSDLVPLLAEEDEVIALSRQDLDITDTTALKDMLDRYSPQVVVNCAAYTAVDRAETERHRAFTVNGLAVQALAMLCAERGIHLCHISTDYVFDGASRRPYTPYDSTRPLNFYGLTKLAGERYIQWCMREFYIVRTSWLYGVRGKNFVKTIMRLARERDTLRVVADQWGSPTWTVTLSKAIKSIIHSGRFGIYHVTDRTEEGITWYDFARAVVELSGLQCSVVPIKTEEYPTPARRPSYSVLDTSLTELTFGLNLPRWDESLRQMLQGLSEM